ncbi:hypothetical protein F3Y22_tig00003398pilonHSYRG00275 [Hibiscus syriacus]|uniref:F-box associated domain-containing protein n=1 Tax=Hibiscus syriacus TaxID=106335 RepID=A0A6A3CRK5_HIBSY|nr:hypothetical protein F3Y22_tig00003398pilonHSYRG00275 [Hibiscus syriacus]
MKMKYQAYMASHVDITTDDDEWCVCKHWFSSFENPHFITKHHQNNLKNNKLNILLKRCHGDTRYLGGIGRIVSHQNPSTREFKILPQSTVQRPPGLLDFSSFNCLGFGYDSQTDDFKVIRFVTHYFEENLDEGLIADWTRQVELYSLKNDSWKEIPFTGVITYVESLVPLNGRSEHEECIIRRPVGGESN